MMSAVIYERNSLRVLGVCDGPDANGRCVRALSDRNVFCGGKDLVLTKDEGDVYCNGLQRGRFAVGSESLCPLIGPGRGIPDPREYFSPFA